MLPYASSFSSERQAFRWMRLNARQKARLKMRQRARARSRPMAKPTMRPTAKLKMRQKARLKMKPMARARMGVKMKLAVVSSPLSLFFFSIPNRSFWFFVFILPSPIPICLQLLLLKLRDPVSAYLSVPGLHERSYQVGVFAHALPAGRLLLGQRYCLL